jgi:membrane-associated protease RseP (regulator of RpoE activity)
VCRKTRDALIRETLRSGTVAGLAMIPFAAVFRGFGMRINEYGRKTLDLVVGGVSPGVHDLLMFVQHIIISWIVAIPLLLVLGTIEVRRTRVVIGALYGVGFYAAVNSLALPLAFGDPPPWQLGFATVYPSLVVHLVYGIALALMARPTHPPVDPWPRTRRASHLGS